MTPTKSTNKNALTDGEKAILARLSRKPLDLYWGRSGWVPTTLPKAAKRADFDRLMNSELVKVFMAQLIRAEDQS